MIAQPLAGWGDAIEVVESDGVRAELARLGAELVARYGTVDDAAPSGGNSRPRTWPSA
jgi:hypothetical protein